MLDVKLRSTQVRAARTRMLAVTASIFLGTIFGLYVLWRLGNWSLERLVYENKSFAIQRIDIQTDGVIVPEQLRRWSGVKAGENLFALDLSRVKRDLELVPLIQSASVERILPGTLRIRIMERVPVAQVNLPRLRAGGGIELDVMHMDAEACVMLPLNPRQSQTPSGSDQSSSQLPIISGINLTELQPGRRVESAPAKAALRLIAAYETSPMAGLVDLKRIDVSAPQVLVVTTGQGSEVTFGMQNFEEQLLRWHEVHGECVKRNQVIASLDLAVNKNPPLRVVEASAVPPPLPKAKPQRTRKKNV